MKNKREQIPSLAKEKETLRLIALSDGLFATVLTLLVLDLRIPEAANSDSGNIMAFVKWVGPHLFSYLLTFLVSGTYWLAHHRDFDYIIHSNRRLLAYNLLFLLFIGLLPFSTAAISLVGFRSSTYPFFWAIYATNIILAGIMLSLTRLYAVSHGLIQPEPTNERDRHVLLRQIVIPAVFLLSIAAEYLFPRAFLGPYTLLMIPLALLLVDRFFENTALKTPSDQSSWIELLWQAGIILPWILIIGIAVWAMSL